MRIKVLAATALLILPALVLIAQAPQHTPRDRPRPGCQSTKVFEVYSVCGADGFWHVVTDEIYACPGPNRGVTTDAVRVHDHRTDQTCVEGAEPPNIRQLLPFGPPQPGDQPMVDGTFTILECLSDGQWYRVKYLRMVAIDGTPRADPKPIDYEPTGRLCKPPANAPPAPNAMATPPQGDTRTAQEQARIDQLVAELDTYLKRTGGETSTALPSTTFVLRPGAILDPNVLVGLLPDDVLEVLVDDMLDSMAEFDRVSQQIEMLTVNTSDLDMETQEQDSILEQIKGSEKLVIASSAPAGDRARPTWWALFKPPVAVLHADQQPAGKLQVLFTSLGVSSGEAFDVQFINNTGKPVEFQPGPMVLQPLKKAAAQRLTREFTQRAGKVTRATMLGYCLQFTKLPPSPGMVFTIAPRAVQARLSGAHDVLRAAGVLQQRGLIKPTGTPAAYFHSIRQWAWWSREQRFTESSFTDAMVEYTKKSLAAGGQKWTQEAETYVRGTAPKRWTDISNVLRLADRAVARRAAR